MKKRKVLNYVVVLLLVASTFVIGFTGEVKAQPYGGEIYATNNEGTQRNTFIEGAELYFTIELNQTEKVNMTVSFRDSEYSLIENKEVTTDNTGTFISSNEGVYFNLTDIRAGDYHVNITSPTGNYNQDTITIHPNYSSGSEINTWNTDLRDQERIYFAEGKNIFFDGLVRGAYQDEVLSNELITIQLIDEDIGVEYYSKEISTNGEGVFEDEFNWDFGFNPDPPGPGNYSIEVVYNYQDVPDVGEEVIANQDIVVYEPDFSVQSTVITTESDHETEKNYFFEGEFIYFRADMKDQYGWSPEEEPDIEVSVKKEGDEVNINLWDLTYDTGSFYGSFWLMDYEFGDYTLRIMDGNEEVEYASNEFTIISVDVSISPEVDIYTQEQEIEIRVESNYPDSIDVAIRDSIDYPSELMDGALWEDRDLVNEFWSAEYTIPEDEEDGTYYVIVNSTENEETLATMEFEIQKFSLEVETNKYEYLPGEEVKAYYTVENLLDGSQYPNVEVEWMMEYYNIENGEWDSLTGEGMAGEFEFILPENAAVYSDFYITVWANDTEGRYQDKVEITRQISDLNLDLNIESNEYFVGQTLYVELQTSTGNVEVDVELHHNDNVVEQRTVVTDGSGYYKVTIDLSGRSPGHYLVRGNATWNDMSDTDDDDFELLDESKRLSVMLERNKGVNPYYPGEEGMVFYTVTHGGETVTDDVNVKYRLYSNQRVLDKDFAEGGEIEFQVPSDYSPSGEGSLWMYVEATMDRETEGDSSIRIPVSIGDILLNPDQWEYEAGDEVSFEYKFQGIGADEIDSLEYRVLDPSYELIMSGTPTEGTFEIVIPENPSSSYRVELEAVTNGGESIETVEWISRVSGFYLKTEIVTESDYTTGIYEPGDEIEISYELVSRDGSPLPETVRVQYSIQGYPGSYHSFRTNETEGTFTLTIPEMNDGEQVLSIQVDEGGNLEIIDVDNDPSLLNKKVLGNVGVSGMMTAILLIIALILAIVALYRTRSRRTSPSKTPRQTQGMERSEIPPEQEGGGEGFQIEEGQSEQENQWSGPQQEEPVDESQMDLEEE